MSRSLSFANSYEALCAGFQWNLPDRLNMAAECLAHPPEQLAIIDLSGPNRIDVTTGMLDDASASLAGALKKRGVRPGDRVGVLRSQGMWCAAAHLAIWRLGAISVPLFKLFRQNALYTRIEDAGVTIVITDAQGAQLVGQLADTLVPELGLNAIPYPNFLDTTPETPAVLIYTSGTTGAPKGALHGHRILRGHMPGVEMSHDRLGQPGDVLWTPADWAWIGGLFDVLMPGLMFGVPVVAARIDKFTSNACIDIIRRTTTRNVFFPPTALRLLKAENAEILGLRTVASGGEPLGAEMLAWGKAALGLTINEFYGQTECNMVASSAASMFNPRPGAIGRAVPGFEIAVVDDNGMPTEGEGDIAIKRGPPSMMLEYWKNPEATQDKFTGDWLVTGDRGRIKDGFIYFIGREDDVITSGGYRIGPAEIEDCLLTHPAVATVGVVGKPDPIRTEIVKAYVVLKEAGAASEAELQDWVKTKLASYSYPREIAFLENLPMTVTGKVIRKELKARAALEIELPD